MLEDGPARALSAESASGGAYVTLGEGRKRQVRRMLEAVGSPVTRLLRYRVGGLWIGNLEVGEYRELSEQELRDLLEPRRIPARVWERHWDTVQRRWG